MQRAIAVIKTKFRIVAEPVTTKMSLGNDNKVCITTIVSISITASTVPTLYFDIIYLLVFSSE